MTAYVIRRLLLAVVTVFMVATVSFFMIRIAPGDALIAKLAGGGRITPAELERGRAELGIDKPVLEQYVDWLGDLAQGDFGNSLIVSSASTMSRVADTLPKTIELVAFATVITLVIAIPVGILAAVKQDSVPDFFARFFAT